METSQPALDKPWTRGLQIFLLAMSVLILEVALTRIFSFIMFHHFTYLVISVAMLGFGVAGTYLTVGKGDHESASADEFVSRNARFFGLAAVGAVVLILRVHFFPLDVYYRHDYSNLLSLALIVLLAGLPFFFAGTCIGFIITRAGTAINRVYFADLTGAATGCLLALLLINHLGAIATCFAVGAIAMLVAAVSSTAGRRRSSVGLLVMAALTAVVAWTEFLPMYAPPYKQMFRKEHLVELVKWHVVTRLDVTRPLKVYYSFGGALSQRYKGEPELVRVIYQDASNLTGIIKPTRTLREMQVLGYYLQGAPYVVKPHARALVIGSGGGVDILIALHHGAAHVVGVDVNPHMIELLRTRYRDFAGEIYHRDHVDLVVSEGRHFLTKDQRRFDVIQLSGVDTFSALSTGAYALSENFIYTLEAFEAYVNHLKPDGIVNVSRPLFPPHTLKLVATEMEALERLDVEHPADHILILAGKGQTAPAPWAQTLVKRSPFTRAEVDKLTRWTTSLGFDVIYDPFTERPGELSTLLQANKPERERLIADHQRNIEPATDDRPFFFQFHRWGDLLTMDLLGRGGPKPSLALLILLGSLLQVLILSAAFILYPLYRRRTPPARHGGRAGIFAYFAALGLGFILIEIVLLQKLTVFLGGPAYAMSVTLFTILLASGIGSFISKRWSANPLRLLAAVIPALVIATVAESLLLDRLLPQLMGLSHLLRGVSVVIMVAPLGLLMGMPFPAGLRHVNACRPELNPWAWGINACATVMGSVLCILISVSFGFRFALHVAAVVYLTGWLFFSMSQARLGASPRAKGL